MKKVVENSFAVTGFVGKDAEIRQFTTASVARFPLAVSRKEQNGEEYVSSFIYVEAWRKNDSTSFELLKKGKNITVKGFFKPDEWTDQQGVKHNRIIMAVTDFYEQESCLTAVSPFKNGFGRFFMFNRYIYAYSLFLTNPPCYIILIPIVPL